MRINFFAIILLGLVAFLQYRLWFESGGVMDMLRMKKQLAIEASVNEKIKKRNNQLIHELQYLQANNAAIEARARGELGMVKKGETFYQVVK